MDSLEYWQKREQDNRNKIIRDEAEYAKRIREILDQTADRMQQQIDSWYMKYAKEEEITKLTGETDHELVKTYVDCVIYNLFTAEEKIKEIGNVN